MKRTVIVFIAILMLAALCAGGCQPPPPAFETKPDVAEAAEQQAEAAKEQAEAEPVELAVIQKTGKAQSIILLIGDGMGFEQVKLGRILNGNRPLHMDMMTHMGYVSTHYSEKYLLSATDSAAAATAIACGSKTKKYSVGMDRDGNAVKSIVDYAKEADKATGLVTTTRITDATPAAFVAHSASRSSEDKIAADLLAKAPDVVLGGGAKRFSAKSRDDKKDLIAQAQSLGYMLVYDAEELEAAEAEKLLGLFANDKMPYTIDKSYKAPTLRQMTEKALDILSRDPDGFFVMIEGARIDHACHANDAVTAAYEVLAFDEAVGAALEFAQNNAGTLVIVTADHETGGLTLGTEDAAATRFVDLLSAQTGSLFESIVHEVDFELKRPDVAAFVKEHFGISKISREENDRLTKAYLDEKDNRRKNDLLFGRALADFLAARSEFYWATRNHSGKDVPVMAFGPYADRFAGYMDNTDIFRLMKDAMGL